MTAPGNATLLFTILAVFLGCTGYAAGRLHQWYRTGIDRDEAYRDGYDTATRSTFSMAARIIGPRRDKAGIRASASVHPADSRSGTQSGAQRSSGSSGARSGSPAGPSAAQPSSAAKPTPPALPPPVETAFPAPPPFEFPEKAPPSRLTSAAWSGAGRPRAEAAAGAAEEAPAEPKRHRRGRHFVPDELVRAVTYRLAPDRVARAKVRQAKRAPEVVPEENPGSRVTAEDGAAPRLASEDGASSRPATDDGAASQPASEDGGSSGRGSGDGSTPRRSLPKPRSS